MKNSLYAMLLTLLGCTSTPPTPTQDIDIVTVTHAGETTRITYQAFNRLFTVYTDEALCHYQTGKSTLITSDNDKAIVQPNDTCERTKHE